MIIPRYALAAAVTTMLAIAISGVYAVSAHAKSTCRDNWICVEEVEAGNRLELHARNLREFPVTYTLRVRTRDYEVDGGETVTRTLAPQQRALALRMNRIVAGESADYAISLAWTVGDQNANHDDDHVYAFPYAQGRAYRILQGYGARFSHRGREEFAIDFDMPEGTPVHAARDGIVARVEERHDRGCWRDGCGRYANYIVVLHSDGTTGEYYHLKQNGAFVEVGDRVVRGQKIGLSGNTGHTTMPHLHFAVYRATSWGETQSIPVRLLSADGIVARPRSGAIHQSVY